MRSEDPAPGRIDDAGMPRASAMASINPSQPVGGEVPNSLLKNRRI
jgi:hypothetical protein